MKIHKIPFILAFSILINLLPKMSFAGDYNVQFSYSPSEMQLKITIDELPSGGTPVLVSVYPKQENKISAELINEQKAVSNIFYSKKDGKTEMTVTLPRDMPGGLYTAAVSCEFVKEFREFTHINSDLAQEALKKLNTAGSADEFTDIIRENMSALGIDSGIIEEYSPQFEKDLFAQRELYFKDGYDIDGFNLSFNSLAVQYKIKFSGAAVNELLRQYADILKISYVSYSELSEECRDYFEKYLINLNSANEPIYKFYELCIIKAKIAAAKRYQELQALIEENAGALGITINVSGNEKTEAFRLLFEKKDEILSNITEAAAIFAECAEKARSKTASKSGGGSSGSGVYWMGTRDTEPKPQNTPEPEVSERAEMLVDITGHWAENVILDMYDKKIVSGYEDGSFRPDIPVSRAEFAAMTVAAFGLQRREGSFVFSDVTDASWYYDAVMCAASNGIISGYEGMFLPEQNITREDTAVILCRALERCGYSPDGLAYFEDRDSISEYAYDAVYRLAGAGIISGFEDDLFMPHNMTTRAQAAQLLSAAMGYMNKDVKQTEGNISSSIEADDTDYILAHAAVEYIGVDEILERADADMVTKSDFTAAVVKAVFPDEIQFAEEKVYEDVGSDHKNFAQIGTAYKYGIISGGGKFNPDSPILQEEAVKICAAVIDTAVSEGDTGYITSYTSKLLENLRKSESSELTKRNAEVLLYNMISCERRPKKSTVLNDTGESIMSVRYNLYVSEDIVTANELTALDSPQGAVAKERLRIGGNTYKYAEGEELIGYNTAVLYKEDNNDDEPAAAAVVPSGNNEISLVPYDIISFSENEIQWSDAQGRTRRCRLKDAFDYIYNGKATVGALPQSFEDFSEVRLIDNDRDGKYDVIKAVKNDYMVVSSANYQDISFSDKNTLKKELKLSDTDHEYRIEGCGSVYDIKAGMTLAYADSEDGLYTRITVLTDTVSGRVTASQDNKLTVNGEEYYCSRYYRECFEKVGIGLNGEFVIDKHKNIVALNSAVSQMSFGFLVNAYSEDDEFYWAKIFTDSGKMERFPFCDKVKLDSSMLDAKKAAAMLYENGSTKRQLIRYSLNADGRVAVIDTKEPGGIRPEDEFFTNNSSDTDGLVLYRFGEPDENAPGEIPTYGSLPTKSYPLVYRRSTLQFYPKFNINGSIIFIVPASADKANDESMYYIGNSTSFKQSTEGIYDDTNVLAYNIANSGSAEAVVYFTDNSFLKPAGSAQSAVVEAVYEGCSEEYGNCSIARLWMNGNFSEYILDENMVFEKRTGGGLCPGDIVRFTEYNGVIKNMVVDFDAAKSSFKATAPGMFNVGTLTMSYQSGLLYSVNESYIYLAPELGNFSYDTRRSALNNAKINTKNVVIIKMRTDRNGEFKVSEIIPAASSDLKSYEACGDGADYILLRQKELSPEMLFAYRFEN